MSIVIEDAEPRSDAALDRLREFVATHARLLVLTGAGVSTASGIPGYRDESGAWQRRMPITAQEFRASAAMRQRYWARSALGWPTIAAAAPNPAHAALTTLERAGRVQALVTQNVDGLHRRAGSERTIELHGDLARVVCLGCGDAQAREALQERMLHENPSFAGLTATRAPDGDAELDPKAIERFRVPECERCGGMLKPDVVFFGENVPRERVRAAFEALDEADAMLVAGSSLMVWSGYRFCEHASRTGKPIAAINRGRTRADALFALKVEGDCSEALATLCTELGAVLR